MTKITWHLEKRKLSELIEWEGNPRNLTEKGIKDLTKSIKKFGCCEPIVINTDNMICGGHGRKKVLEQLDVKEVDCYVPHETLTKEEFEELFQEKIEIIPLDYEYKYIHRKRYYSIAVVHYNFCSARNPFVVLDNAESFMLNENVTALIQYIPFEKSYYSKGLHTEIGAGIPVRKKQVADNKER